MREVNVIEPVVLRDGSAAVFWPLLPTDRELLAAAYADLSPESRRRRFLAAVDRLTPAMLDRLVDDVDGINHIALVLFAEDGQEGRFDPVGVGRIVRYDEDPDTADIAVTVKDEWHNRGVATALLAELVRQRPVGVTHLLTEVLADNPASLAMLKRLGPTRTEREGSGVLEVQVDLGGAGTWREDLTGAPGESRSIRLRWPWRSVDAAGSAAEADVETHSQSPSATEPEPEPETEPSGA